MSTPRPLVVKLGGRALDNPEQLQPLLQRIIETSRQRPVAVVHGGGNLIDTWLQTFGSQIEKQQGLRVTRKTDVPVVAGALAGALNTQLTSAFQHLGATAIGLSLIDGGWCVCRHDSARGQVGIPEVTLADSTFLQSILKNQWLPVFNPIGALADGQVVNVNADLAAACVAQALHADLLLLTDVEAILDNTGQVIHTLTIKQGEELLQNQTVQGGMKVKLQAALQAHQYNLTSPSQRRSTAVAAWFHPAPLSAFFSGDAPATRIVS